MNKQWYFQAFVEDELQEHLLRKTVQLFPRISIEQLTVKKGNGHLKKHCSGYNAAAHFSPYLLMTDLDEWECPLALIGEWFQGEIFSENLLFCICIREAESWLMADRNSFARYMGISPAKIPTHPETTTNPKQLLINLAHESKKREIREGIIPKGTASIGQRYNTLLGTYVREY